jgi:hypothetical protein
LQGFKQKVMLVLTQELPPQLQELQEQQEVVKLQVIVQEREFIMLFKVLEVF